MHYIHSIFISSNKVCKLKYVYVYMCFGMYVCMCFGMYVCVFRHVCVYVSVCVCISLYVFYLSLWSQTYCLLCSILREIYYKLINNLFNRLKAVIFMQLVPRNPSRCSWSYFFYLLKTDNTFIVQLMMWTC